MPSSSEHALDLALFRGCDVLYLDPEWGGEGYKSSDKLQLTIGGQLLHDSVLDALRASSRLRWVVLKLPVNYDRDHIRHILAAASQPGKSASAIFANSYKVHVNNQAKMEFVVLERLPAGRTGKAVGAVEWVSSKPEDLFVQPKPKHAKQTPSPQNGDYFLGGWGYRCGNDFKPRPRREIGGLDDPFSHGRPQEQRLRRDTGWLDGLSGRSGTQARHSPAPLLPTTSVCWHTGAPACSSSPSLRCGIAAMKAIFILAV